MFSEAGTYPVAVRDRSGTEYVALLDVLERIGVTSGKPDGKKYTVRFGGTDVNFAIGKTNVKVRGKTVDLGAPADMDENMLLVPVRGLAPLMSQLLKAQAELREPGARLMLVPPISFESDLSANPSRLVLHFSRAVSPNLSSEPGRLRLNFTNDPVTAPQATQNYADKLITAAAYSETNGNAVLTVTGSAPLLATFSDEGKTITISAAPQAVAQKASPAPSQPPPNKAQVMPPAAPQSNPGPVAQPAPRFLVVIDPAHGGDDKGAVLATDLSEKDITLALARRLRNALTGAGVAVILLRDADTSLTEDQRAALADGDHATVFVNVHAGTVGRGVRTYTARMSAPAPAAGGMLPWDTAQAGFLDSSRQLAASIGAQLGKSSIEHAESSAQLQPLPHITAAAVSVEFLPDDQGVASLMSPEYQQRVCAAVAEGIAASRRVLEARR